VLGYLPKLLAILITIAVVVPFTTIYFGLVHWSLSFFWMFAGVLGAYLYYRRESKQRESMNYAEVVSEERRNNALKEWVEMHKPKEDKQAE